MGGPLMRIQGPGISHPAGSKVITGLGRPAPPNLF